MTQGDKQQESLNTLKLINAASTALRLYPEESAQVTNSVENAYQGTKSFLRDNQLLRFSFLNGGYLLNGEPVDKPTQERLQLLTFSDHLQKMELDELVLSKGVDRSTFKKILSVFSATPEQVSRAGGSRAFIENLDLVATFPKEYFPPGESEEEKKQKQKADIILKDLSAGFVRSSHILYLVGRKQGKELQIVLQEVFQSPEASTHIIATTIYSILQVLRKDHLVVVAPAFSKMLDNVSSILPAGQHKTVSDKVASLLAPYLVQRSVLMLVCQEFSSAFGRTFYDALLLNTDSQLLTKVLEWMQEQQKKVKQRGEKLPLQHKVVAKGYEKLSTTSRGKQILAMGSIRSVLQQTEQGRKETRLHTGISALAQGDLTSLGNKEVCLSLPATIEKLLNNDKESVAAAIIQNVVKGLQDKEHALRVPFARVLGGIAAKLAYLNRWGWLEKLTPVCLAWVRENETADRGLEHHIRALQAMMNHAWYSKNSELAEQILDLFYFIRSGAFEKNDDVCRMVGRIQDKNVDVVLLRGYLERCFVRPVDEMICRKILMQGPVAARFLLDTLITTEKRADRIRLLKILSELKSDLVPVLLERLPDPMPWFGKRNIIRLLAVTGSEEDVEAILGYASHEDLRVQQEMLQCIVRIGKTSTQKYLLMILPETGVKTKVQVVKNLRRGANESAVAPLAKLVGECSLYSNGPEKNELALEICNTLGASGSSDAFAVLQRIINGGAKQFGKKSIKAAELAITLIQEQGNRQGEIQEKKEKVEAKGKVADVKTVGVKAPPSVTKEYPCITDYPEEKEVYELLKKDKKQASKNLLVELIEKTAKLRRFNEAEALRLRLIEIDGMALSEIIKAAEIIEDAKSDSIDKNHILIWADLYDLLTTEEFNTFYHALEHATYPTETVIVKQGDPQWRLFFVNKGRVKLYFNEKENETLVKTIGQGNVFGGASFFDDSIWTLNAASMGNVEVSTLAMKCVEEWAEEYPGIETKIQDYCLRFDRVNEFFLTSGAERRQEERLPISDAIAITLLDDAGVATDTTIRGDGIDISTGGVSFLSRISQRKQARTLLGRRVAMDFKDSTGEETKMELSGTVVAVRNLHSAELGRSVHVSFDTELDSKKMTDFVNGS